MLRLRRIAFFPGGMPLASRRKLFLKSLLRPVALQQSGSLLELCLGLFAPLFEVRVGLCQPSLQVCQCAFDFGLVLVPRRYLLRVQRLNALLDLCRAVAMLAVPVVSAVGHERDVTLIDDLRIYEDGPFEQGAMPDFAQTLPPHLRNIDFVLRRPWSETHDLQRFHQHTGYLVLAPRRAKR